MRLITEYLERSLEFEQLAASEHDEVLKRKLLKQSTDYRKLAERRAARLGLVMPRGEDGKSKR